MEARNVHFSKVHSRIVESVRTGDQVFKLKNLFIRSQNGLGMIDRLFGLGGGDKLDALTCWYGGFEDVGQFHLEVAGEKFDFGLGKPRNIGAIGKDGLPVNINVLQKAGVIQTTTLEPNHLAIEYFNEVPQLSVMGRQSILVLRANGNNQSTIFVLTASGSSGYKIPTSLSILEPVSNQPEQYSINDIYVSRDCFNVQEQILTSHDHFTLQSNDTILLPLGPRKMPAGRRTGPMVWLMTVFEPTVAQEKSLLPAINPPRPLTQLPTARRVIYEPPQDEALDDGLDAPCQIWRPSDLALTLDQKKGNDHLEAELDNQAVPIYAASFGGEASEPDEARTVLFSPAVEVHGDPGPNHDNCLIWTHFAATSDNNVYNWYSKQAQTLKVKKLGQFEREISRGVNFADPLNSIDESYHSRLHEMADAAFQAYNGQGQITFLDMLGKFVFNTLLRFRAVQDIARLNNYQAIERVAVSESVNDEMMAMTADGTIVEIKPSLDPRTIMYSPDATQREKAPFVTIEACRIADRVDKQNEPVDYERGCRLVADVEVGKPIQYSQIEGRPNNHFTTSPVVWLAVKRS